MNEDIYYCILKFLPLKDIIKCKTVNKSFNNATQFEPLWKHIFNNDFSNNMCHTGDIYFTYYETCKFYYLVEKKN